MNAEFKFKRSMTLGSGAAENDGEFLEKCFVRTSDFESLLDYTDRRFILLGRTGSGKTALLRMALEKIAVSIQIRPDTFAMQYISNIPFIRELNSLGINLEIFYKFLWLHEILSKIIRSYFAYNRKNFIAQFVQHVANPYRIGQMKRYFEEYGDVFFEEKSAENITQQLESKIFANVGDVKRLAIGGSISELEKKDIQTKASTCVNTTQINQLKNIITLLKEYLSENRQRKIFVAIDDLDTNWIADKTKYQLIGALLSTLRLFVDVPNLKIVIAMRSDVFRKTCIETKRQNEKDEAFTLKLNWTKDLLKEILEQRLGHLYSHKYQKNYLVRIEDLFVKEVEKKPIFEYLVERTMMRPRDLITFVNFCIENSDGKSVVDEASLKVSEREYLHNRFDAIVSEWHEVYPAVQSLVRLLYKLPNEFSMDNLLSAYKVFEAELLSRNDEDDPLVKKILTISADDKAAVEALMKELLDVWYIIGVVGKQDEVSLTFSTPNHPSLDEIDFADAQWYEVHPLFRHSLPM